MTDYTIDTTTPGLPVASFAPSSGLFNNVYLSLEIPKGGWWFDPTFGLRQRKRLKNNAATASLLKKDIEDALQWLLDAGRAQSVTVTPSSVPGRKNWLKMLVEVTAASGEVASYEKFIEVT